MAARKKVFQNVQLEPEQKILLIGVGTGANLAFIMNKEAEITGIDLSSDMLQKAKKKYGSPQVTFLEMDAQELTFLQESFDLVIANLILSVVPDPDQCFREMLRVTRTGGRIVIFDKFVLPNQELTLSKKILRPIIRMMGTDIGRQFEHIVQPYSKSIVVAEDSPILFNGMYRSILLRKI